MFWFLCSKDKINIFDLKLFYLSNGVTADVAIQIDAIFKILVLLCASRNPVKWFHSIVKSAPVLFPEACAAKTLAVNVHLLWILCSLCVWGTKALQSNPNASDISTFQVHVPIICKAVGGLQCILFFLCFFRILLLNWNWNKVFI